MNDEHGLMRTAKSCGPGAPMLALSSAESHRGATVATKPGHRGELEVSRKPLRREGRIASAEPVCSCAFSYVHFAHETAGAACTRSSLRPLLINGGERDARLGRNTPRECGRISSSRSVGKAKRATVTSGALTGAGAWASSPTLLAMKRMTAGKSEIEPQAFGTTSHCEERQRSVRSQTIVSTAVRARRPSIGYAGSLNPGVDGWPGATRRSISASSSAVKR